MLIVRCGTVELLTALIIFAPSLIDAALLVVLAHHVAGGVLQEQERRVALVGELDELGRLVRLLVEEHAAVVGEDADRVAVDLGQPGDERRAVARLELVELAVVDDPGEHVARVERARAGRPTGCRAARSGS